MRKVRPNWGYRFRHPWLYWLSRLGHWEYEHPFKTCPTGERWCPHGRWRPGH